MKMISLRVLKKDWRLWKAGYDVLGAVISTDQVGSMIDASEDVFDRGGPVTRITLKDGAVLLVDEKLADIETKIREALA